MVLSCMVLGLFGKAKALIEFVLKAILGGLIIATASWLSEKSATFAAIVMGIPLSSFMVLIFAYYGGMDFDTMSKFSFETIYFVLLSLIFFVIFGFGIHYVGFWWSMIGGIVATVILFNLLIDKLV